MRRRFARRSAATLVLLVVVASNVAWGMSVLPLDLAQLTAQAGSVFVGRVERVDTGRDAHGLPAVWTTFAVGEVLKGGPATHVTLKELGATFGGPDTPIAPRPGLPRYAAGESVVLFVHPESTLGFTSPVGLGQGCFRISARDGRSVVENDVGNRNLAADGSAAQARTGAPATDASTPLPLDTFLGRVRALVAATP